MNSCLFLNTFYDGFLKQCYGESELQSKSYEMQLSVLNGAGFGDSDFYSSGLRSSAWEAEDIIFNCAPLQVAWAKEHGVQAASLFDILEAQVRYYSPDVLYIQDMHSFGQEHLERLRKWTNLIVGQIASPVGDNIPLQMYDLVVSCCPHFVTRFRENGVRAEYQPLAFAPRLLKDVSVPQKDIALSFVGGISGMHTQGNHFLTTCASQMRLDIWGYGGDLIPEGHPLGRYHHGPVFGLDYFRVLARSKMTLNRHIDIAENYACNMRMYEATGVGTLLITDMKSNLGKLFEIGKEVVAYSSPEEAVEIIKYLTENPKIVEQIAAAGQVRTLRDHTYAKRMRQTASWLETLLASKATGQVRAASASL